MIIIIIIAVINEKEESTHIPWGVEVGGTLNVAELDLVGRHWWSNGCWEFNLIYSLIVA